MRKNISNLKEERELIIDLIKTHCGGLFSS